MKKLLRSVSIILLVVALLGCFGVTAPFIDPPVTDQSLMLFIKGPDYLPSKDELTRAEIAPALSRFLTEERRGYRIVFYFACVGMVGVLGLLSALAMDSPRSRGAVNQLPRPTP